MHDAECAEVDDFVNGHKTLVGFKPPWGKQFAGIVQCRWGIADIHGAEPAELCLSINRDWRHQTIACMFRQKPIYRLDIAPKTECKDNWHTGEALGLQPVVCGPHVHGWHENREYVRINGFGRLPVRREISGSVLTLLDAIHWVADDLNIQIDPGQRDIDMPERTLV